MPPGDPSEPGQPTLPGMRASDGSRDRWYLYVDLDAFYVSCELRDRPELRGRPVIVGPPPGDGPTRGVVLSASYEARPSGVRSAMPVQAAARLCPDAVWIPPDFSKYERASREVRVLLHRHSELVLPFSIDEAAVVLGDVTIEAAREEAERIQAELRSELELPASIGIARSRLIAKIATDRAKPAGVLTVAPGDTAAFLEPMPVRAIPGVGPKTEQILKECGIATIGELARRKPSDLASRLGPFGADLIALARGHPREEGEGDDGPRSRSTDRTFPEDVEAWDALESAIRELARDLGEALEQEELRYGTVGVAFRWADFSRSQRSRALGAAHEGVTPLVEAAVRIGRELWENEQRGHRRSVRTASVRTERLVARRQRQVFLDEFPR